MSHGTNGRDIAECQEGMEPKNGKLLGTGILSLSLSFRLSVLFLSDCFFPQDEPLLSLDCMVEGGHL